MRDPLRIYRTLLRLYPARFREEFAAPIERQVRDEYGDARGAGARLRFWGRALRDLATSIPVEVIREAGQDLRYASRVYRKRSLVTALALTALALGIGATTGVFSVLNALLLRSLPFHEPERLVQVVSPKVNALSGRAAFYRWGQTSPYADSIATYTLHEMNLAVHEQSVRVKVAETSANFLRLMGVLPAIGRNFAPDEDLAGRDDGRSSGTGYGWSFSAAIRARWERPSASTERPSR
jgi:putative ABC transport system permease protein